MKISGKKGETLKAKLNDNLVVFVKEGMTSGEKSM